MRCPTHVKQFGAYPYRNITGRSYYYQCNGNQQADLKKCEEGEEYDPNQIKLAIVNAFLDFDKTLMNTPNADFPTRYSEKAIITQPLFI